MLTFTESGGCKLPPLTDEEVRWLHDDPTARRPSTVNADLANTPEDERPLVRTGPGGDFIKDYHAGAVSAPRTGKAKEGYRPRGEWTEAVAWWFIAIVYGWALGIAIAMAVGA